MEAARLGYEPPPPIYPPDSLGSPPLFDLSTLRKQAEETFGLSYLDEFTLYGAWRVIQRKVVPKFMNGNSALTIMGFAAAFLTYAQNALQNGTITPQAPKDYVVIVLGGVLAGMGWLAKAYTTGSQPGDPQTPARIAGALAAGETVKQVDVDKSADAVKSVVASAKG